MQRLMVVFQDVSTGYLLREDVAEDRTYPTWKAAGDERINALGTHVLYVVSDRAKALVQLAETGFECVSRPDVFHLVHDIVKSYALAMGRRLRQAQQELTHAEEKHARRQGRGLSPQEGQEDVLLVAARPC